MNGLFFKPHILHFAATFFSLVISNRKTALTFLASSGWDEARCAISLNKASVWRLPED